MKVVRRAAADAGGHGHRHSPPGQHEHEYEPQYGLPEALPADERILWQGRPDWKTLAVQRFHVRKLVVYFALMLAARVVALVSDGAGVGAALMGSVLLLILSVLAVALIAFTAWMTARTTVYTITDKRVVMRIGIVLTLTLNLPLRRMAAAGLQMHGKQHGDIALQLLGNDRIAFVHLWPHARRWRFVKPEPTLLCLAQAGAVAHTLTTAWSAANGEKARVLSPAAVVATPDLAPTLATR